MYICRNRMILIIFYKLTVLFCMNSLYRVCIRRTSQLSVSALQEFVKGQEGELAVGREIANPGILTIENPRPCTNNTFVNLAGYIMEYFLNVDLTARVVNCIPSFSGSYHIGDLSFLLGSMTQDYDPGTVQWQWLLGRLCMLLKLIEEHPTGKIPNVYKRKQTEYICTAGCIYVAKDRIFHEMKKNLLQSF